MSREISPGIRRPPTLCRYSFERIGSDGEQIEEPVQWSPGDWLESVDARCVVEIEGRRVEIGARRREGNGRTARWDTRDEPR